MLEYAPIWQAAEKIVYSTTLQTVSTAKTRLERKFDADVVRELKAGATREVAVGGPALAAHAIRAGLVDEYHLLIAPIIAGGGNPYLPGKVAVKLELLDERRFDNGMVHVRYRASSKTATPSMIAMSATLKMPVRSGPTPMFRKSTTLPRTRRSTQFDAPPARTRLVPIKATDATGSEQRLPPMLRA